MENMYKTTNPFVNSFFDRSNPNFVMYNQDINEMGGMSGSVMPDTSATKITTTNNMKLGDPNNMVDTRSNPMVQSQQAIVNSGQGFLNEESMQNVLSQPAGDVNAMVQGSQSVASFDSRDYSEPIRSAQSSGMPELEMKQLPTDTSFLEPMQVSMGDKLKSGLSTLKENASTALAFSPLVGAIAGMAQTRSNIGNLRNARDDIRSAISGLAEERESSENFLRDQYSENRRRSGARLRDNVLQALDRVSNVRTGNLVSGSKVEKQEDIVDVAQTNFDLNEAALFDRYQSDLSRSLDANRNQRGQLNTQLDRVNKQLEDEKRKQITGPLSAIADVGSNLLMASNPALAIGMQVGKTLIS